MVETVAHSFDVASFHDLLQAADRVLLRASPAEPNLQDMRHDERVSHWWHEQAPSIVSYALVSIVSCHLSEALHIGIGQASGDLRLVWFVVCHRGFSLAPLAHQAQVGAEPARPGRAWFRLVVKIKLLLILTCRFEVRGPTQAWMR